MTKPADWTDDPATRRWMGHVRAELIPKLRDSAATVSIAPTSGETDIKFAVELGLSIMMDKPIVLMVAPGVPVPPKLRALADEVVEGEIADETTAQRMGQALNRILGNDDEQEAT